MSNWKHEEVKAITQAFDRALSAPRAEGKCQALIYASRPGEAKMRCLQCGFDVQGTHEHIVPLWNAHIIYR